MKKITSLVALMLAVLLAFVGCVAAEIQENTTAETTVETTAADTAAEETTAAVTEEEYVANYPNGYDYASSDLEKHVTLGNYKGLTVEITTPEELPAEELAEIIYYYRSQYATAGEEITGRAAILTDTVNIDYSGAIDGVKFDGGTAEGQTLLLGSGSFIPGFEDGVVGMNIGETKVIDATFPTDYHAADLAGKTAQFTVTLNSIAPTVLPEYNDEFVNSNFASYGITTVAEFEQYFKNEHAYSLIEVKNAAVIEVITASSKINGYPEGLVEDYYNQQVIAEKGYAEAYEMELEEYVSMGYGITLEEYETYVKDSAKAMIAQEMVIFAIAKAEGITVSEEDTATEIANYLVYYGYDTKEELIEAMGMSEELFENSVNFSITYNKVMELLRENTTFIYKEN